MQTETNTVPVLGVRINDQPLSILVNNIINIIESDQKAIVSNVNVHALNIACEQKWFRDFLNQSEIVFCDGFGVWLGALLGGKRLRYRYTPPDWIGTLAECAGERLTFYFLGSKPGVAQRAGERLQKRVPVIRLVGTQHGYFKKAKDDPENVALVQQINNLRPNILLVGFGMPMQERWILENIEDLQVNVILPVGALFDYVAGDIVRAPRWMTDHGLEWLGRLIIEPRRLWRRYIIGNPLFLWRVFVHDVLGHPLPY